MLGKFWLYAYAFGMCIKPFEGLPLVIKHPFEDSGGADWLHIWLFFCSEAVTNFDQIYLQHLLSKEKINSRIKFLTLMFM